MVISSEPHPSPQVTRPPATGRQPEGKAIMDKAPASSRRIADPDDAAVSARLAAIEERLDEIIRRLDEL
jgi:hypothetical protein